MTNALAGSSVLVIGLDPRRVPGPWDPEPVVRAIEAGMAELAFHGVVAETCLVGLDGSDDIEDRVAGALRSGRWDCVVVGGGIRKDEGFLDLFESIVNLVRVCAPEAQIAFNDAPENLLGSVARRLGD